MTSEELLRHYYDDAGKKEQLLKTLYEKNRGMILAAAREIASAFHMERWRRKSPRRDPG